jgi:predicted PurR-regulated permease PerM
LGGGREGSWCRYSWRRSSSGRLDNARGCVAIFLAGQGIADYVLAPFLIAERVHLTPVEVMFAIAAFGCLFGFVGLLIAVPLAAAIGVPIRFAAKQYAPRRARWAGRS